MINGKRVFAVIPARSGSKRCANKNFLPYHGKPLWQWAEHAAAGSKYIDQIFISLDEHRPPDLCTDDATCEDVLRFHLAQYPADWVVLLQPTSPNRTTEDIDACIERAQLGYGCISTFHGKTNGAVYVASAEWLAAHDFSHMGLMKYEMEESHSLDINFPEDFNVE